MPLSVTSARSIDGAEATPSPLVITTRPSVPVTARVVAVPSPVRTMIPEVERPSTAARSLASANVGLPTTPSAAVMVKPAAGATRVRLVNVSAAVSTTRPAVESRPARAVRVASSGCLSSSCV